MNEEYYEAMLDMFLSRGWKYLMEDFTELESQLDTLRDVDGIERLHFQKGQLDVLRRVVNFEETIRRTMEDEAV